MFYCLDALIENDVSENEVIEVAECFNLAKYIVCRNENNEISISLAFYTSEEFFLFLREIGENETVETVLTLTRVYFDE